jgi:uncharacterized damage-inducible protein DinB
MSTSIAQALLPEFDHEAAVTRTVLERVPEAQAGWRPHPKSMTLGELAIHLASIPAWGVLTLRERQFDLSPPGAPAYTPPAWQSLAQTLAVFDEKIGKTRAALVAVTDLELAQPWTLKKGGDKVFTAPRGSVLRSFVLNHSVHHRAQLGLYLRMLDVPVPAMYGPTADTR